MKTHTLAARTLIKDEKQLERANEYTKTHEFATVSEHEKTGKAYLTESFEFEECETFAELVKKYDEKEIVSKFNEIRVIRLQDSKRNLLKASIEDKITSERAQLSAIAKISGLSATEIAEKLGITL